MKCGRNPHSLMNRSDMHYCHFYIEEKNLKMINDYAREHEMSRSLALNELLDQQRKKVLV